MRFTRACGVLLHPSSLFGPFGIGDLGPNAHRYVEWLARTGVSWWQVLPLHPPGGAHSPYQATSTFAGDALLISPDLLIEDGLLEPDGARDHPAFPDHTIDFRAVAPFKERAMRRAWDCFAGAPPAGMAEGLLAFRTQNSAWLADFALFAALSRAHGGATWQDWPQRYALRDARSLSAWRRAHQNEVRFEEFCQYVFARQWSRLRRRAHEVGTRIIGDLPIYVAGNSAEVWAHRELFRLDADGHPTAVAGVPPDYFSKDGQLWGNPLYDWGALERTGFRWWIERLRFTLRQVDAVRLDHFRGFAAHWSVPAGERTARAGKWETGPGRALFDALRGELGELPVIAEDLGVITEDVTALREELGFPGMAVLQFAFSPAPRTGFVPYRHRANQVVYTGTHDNNTAAGWYRDDAGEAERDFLRRYLATDAHEVHWDLIRAALASVADLAVIPHQDIAGLGPEARMNTPSSTAGNWRFRLPEWALSDWHRARLAELIWIYGRTPEAH